MLERERERERERKGQFVDMAQRLRHMNPVKHSRMRLPVRPEEGSIGEGQLATDVPIGTSIVAKRTACKREAKEREKPGSSGCVRLRAAAAALLLLLQVARHATTYYKTKQQTTKMDNLCVDFVFDYFSHRNIALHWWFGFEVPRRFGEDPLCQASFRRCCRRSRI